MLSTFCNKNAEKLKRSLEEPLKMLESIEMENYKELGFRTP